METKYVPVIKLFRRDEKNSRIHNRMTDIPRKSILSDIHDFSGWRCSTLVTGDSHARAKLCRTRVSRFIVLSLFSEVKYLFYEINDEGQGNYEKLREMAK